MHGRRKAKLIGLRKYIVKGAILHRGRSLLSTIALFRLMIKNHENQSESAYTTIIIRPHRSTTYVDAAYCYRPSSVVCRSVCQSITLMSCAKTAEAIEMPFALKTRVGPRNHVLDITERF